MAQLGEGSGCEGAAEAADHIRPLIVSIDNILLSFSLHLSVDIDLVVSSASEGRYIM